MPKSPAAAGATEPKTAPARRAPRSKAKRAGPATLVISEKQIAAQRIAEILSDGKAKRTGAGKIPIFTFEREGREFRVVGLSGHVVEVDYPSEANRWHQIKPRDLIFVDPIKKVPRTYKAIVDALKKAADGSDEIVVATDFDREGELIGKEGVELVDGAGQRRIRRARFSSLTPKELRQAFSKPADLDLNLAAAGESRQIVDLVWGAVLTRFITMAARTTGREVLSVGRVQSPTLALIVDLEKQIRAFKPQPYWLIRANLGEAPGFEAFHLGPAARTGRPVEEAKDEPATEEDEDAQAMRFPARAFTDEAQATQVFESIRDLKSAAVQEVARSPRTESAPAPFNTTAFLQAAAGQGVSTGRAMQLAETLYMRGFISYPRTDNTVYPPTEDLDAIVESLSTAGPFRADVAYLSTVRRPEPTRGKKTATDHPPIHPVEAARPGDLAPDEWKVYELVVRRFLATLAQDAKGESLKVDLRLGDEPFRATGYSIQFWGWKKLYPYIGSEDRPLPDLQPGQRVPVNEVMLDRKDTQPPKRYGQGRLIAEMERLGLGTKSTRHEIIEKLMAREYVRGPKTLEPTQVGFAVTDVLEKYAEVVTKPDMTAQLEQEMELVAQGDKKLDEVVKDSRSLLDQAVGLLEQNRDKLGSDLSAALVGHNTIGPCPRCGKPLNMIRARSGKRFVGCSGYPECRQTYPLPQMGRVQPMPDARCDACNSPMARILSAGRRPWEICLNMECPKRAQRQALPAEPKEKTAEVED